MWGAPKYNPASRFTDEIPAHLVDWRNLGAARPPFLPRRDARPSESRASRPSGTAPSFGSRPAIKTVASVQVGERVLHTTFGLGTVIATHGAGDQALADIDFGSAGVKRLSLRHAPMEKL
jgi:DNA helicase-2/ATP-dependent DNA helicase PcrA